MFSEFHGGAVPEGLWSLLLGVHDLPDVTRALLLEISNGSSKVFADIRPVTLARMEMSHRVLDELLGVHAAARAAFSAVPLTPQELLPEGCVPDSVPQFRTWDESVALLKPQGYLWIEVVAGGGFVSPAAITVVFEEVFREATFLAALNNPHFRPRRRFFSFEERCEASDCGHLVEAVGLDETFAAATRWDALPRQRLQASSQRPCAPLQAFDVEAFRLPSLLAREASIRGQLRNISRSWRTVASGLTCWSLYLREFWPFRPPFQPSLDMLTGFASHFRHASTLSKYVSNVALGARPCTLR